MNIGDYLLIAGFAAGFIELFVLIWFKSHEKDKWYRYSEIFAGISTFFVAVALVLLARYFLTDNFSFQYVVENSQADSPTLIKLSGVWSGQSGSLLLWAGLIGFFTFLYKVTSKRIEPPEVAQRTNVILTLINIAFILLILLDSPFETRRTILDGFGLNPLLRTNWNVIHPFVVFVGYAATTVPFAIALSRLFSRDTATKQLKSHLDFHMSIAWLTLSLGIILGGYWAYITLGWGGYWAWDPVETGSLIPWILCTAYFHPRPLFKSNSRVPSLIAAFSFIMVLYATYVTRGGALQSVHAFSESPVIGGIIILILVALSAIVVSYAVNRPSFGGGFIDRFRTMSLYNQAMSISFICLIVLAFVCSMGIILPLILLITTGAQYSVEPAFYTYGCAPFVIILLLALITCHLTRNRKDYDLKRLIRLFAIPLVLGVILVFLETPTSNIIANFGIPLLILAIGVTIYQMLHSSFSIESFKRALQESSRAAIHAGLAIILLGAFVSSTMTVHENSGQTIEIPIGMTMSMEDTGISVRIYDTSFAQYNSDVDFVMLVTIGVIDGGNIYLETAELTADQNYLNADGNPNLYAYPAVFHRLWRDIYISVIGISQDTALIRVTVLNLVSFVWIGSILLCIGIVPLLSYRAMEIIRDPEQQVKQEQEPETSNKPA